MTSAALVDQEMPEASSCLLLPMGTLLDDAAVENKTNHEEATEQEHCPNLTPSRQPPIALLWTNATEVNLSGRGLTSAPPEVWALPHLVRLDLSHNLIAALPSAPAACRSSLAELDLSYNALVVVPAWLNDCPRLRKLVLRRNPLSSLGFGKLNAQFGRRNRLLRFLDVSDCGVVDLLPRHLFGALDLQELRLGHKVTPPNPSLQNVFYSLPAHLAMSVGIVKLVACNLRLSDLPESITALRSLKHLDLSRNALTWLPSTLHRLTKLETLDLSRNCLDSLPFGVEKLRNLQELYASHNNICWVSEDVDEFGDAFQTLDLYRNRLDLDGAIPMSGMSLERLDLGDNRLSLSDIETRLGLANYEKAQTKLREQLGERDRSDPPEFYAEPLVETPSSSSGDDSSEKEEEFTSEEDISGGEIKPFGSDPVFEWNEEEKGAVAEIPVPPKFRFLWDNLRDENDDEDGRGHADVGDSDAWSTFTAKDDDFESWEPGNARATHHRSVTKYDFSDMSRYCSGDLQFCPADQHAKPVLWTVAESADSAHHGGGGPLSEKRPGRMWRDEFVAKVLTSPRRSRRTSSVASSYVDGQFEDA